MYSSSNHQLKGGLTLSYERETQKGLFFLFLFRALLLRFYLLSFRVCSCGFWFDKGVRARKRALTDLRGTLKVKLTKITTRGS